MGKDTRSPKRSRPTTPRAIRRSCLVALAVGLTLVFSGSALAQQPESPAAPTTGPDVPTTAPDHPAPTTAPDEPRRLPGRPSPLSIEPTLKSVIYIVDCSGSMFDVFDFVKAELARAIHAQPAGQEFHIIFFTDDRALELAIQGMAGLRPATDAAKGAACEWINAREAQSRGNSSNPKEALSRALKYRPDAIVLISDGALDWGIEEDALKKMVQGSPPIHVIVCDIQPAIYRDATGHRTRLILLDRLARWTGGKFTRVACSYEGPPHLRVVKGSTPLELEAERRLRLIGLYLDNNMNERAREMLEELLRECPGTPAAAEGRKELDKLPR